MFNTCLEGKTGDSWIYIRYHKSMIDTYDEFSALFSKGKGYA